MIKRLAIASTLLAASLTISNSVFAQEGVPLGIEEIKTKIVGRWQMQTKDCGCTGDEQPKIERLPYTHVLVEFRADGTFTSLSFALGRPETKTTMKGIWSIHLEEIGGGEMEPALRMETTTLVHEKGEQEFNALSQDMVLMSTLSDDFFGLTGIWNASEGEASHPCQEGQALQSYYNRLK